MIAQDKLEGLTDNLNRYVKTNYELIKLEAAETSCIVGSKLIVNLFLLLVAVFLLLFVSLGLGFYLSNYFGNNYFGFIIIASFYFLLGCILMIGKRRLIETPLRNKIIRKVFSN